jgi:hypothetical protein
MSGETGTFKMYVGAGNSATWRGLSLSQTTAQSVLAGASDAIAWDVVFAETDGIRSTGTHGPYGSGITVPVGAAGVVPSGMAGLWRVGGNMDVYPAASGGVVAAFGIIVNDFSPFWEDDLSAFDFGIPGDFNLTISPIVYPLSEGDVVWCNFLNNLDGSANVGGTDSTFLMEYLGPVP